MRIEGNGIKRNFNIINVIYEKSIANIILNSKRLKVFPENQKWDMMSVSVALVQRNIRSSN